MRVCTTLRSIPMHRHVARFLGVPAGICILGLVAGQPARQLAPPNATVASLSWLTGCWVEDLGAVRVIDEWSAPAGHTMLGVSRELRRDSTAALELRQLTDSAGTLRLVSISDAGQLSFHSARRASKGIELVNTTAGRRNVIRFTHGDALQLEIGHERSFGGVARTIEELFVRVPCASEIDARRR